MFIEAGPIESNGRDQCIIAGYEFIGKIIKYLKLNTIYTEPILQMN
jgi:hypothetical protein